jgi:hypothetical protein
VNHEVTPPPKKKKRSLREEERAVGAHTQGWVMGAFLFFLVRSHAERRRKPGERWAAVKVGNGIADRAADHPEGSLQTGLVLNRITPVE